MVSNYASHSLHANEQFSAIEKMCSQWNISIHHLSFSRPQTKKIADELSGGTGWLLWWKRHEFVGNCGYKVESWWGSQWIWILIFDHAIKG